MDEDIKENLYDLYASYRHHKQLFEFYQQHKRIKGEQEIRDRIDYIKKHKIKPRNELETLLWVLGELGIEDIDG